MTPGRAPRSPAQQGCCGLQLCGDPGGRAWPRLRAASGLRTLSAASHARSPSQKRKLSRPWYPDSPQLPVLRPHASPPHVLAPCPHRRPCSLPASGKEACSTPALSAASGEARLLSVCWPQRQHTPVRACPGPDRAPETRPVGPWNLTGKKGGL